MPKSNNKVTKPKVPKKGKQPKRQDIGAMLQADMDGAPFNMALFAALMAPAVNLVVIGGTNGKQRRKRPAPVNPNV